MKKLKLKRDLEFVYQDYNEEFDFFKLIIKKNTMINIEYDNESEIIENPIQSVFDRCYQITFYPSHYNKNDVNIIIIQESENDENDIEEIRKEEFYLEINPNDVEMIEE